MLVGTFMRPDILRVSAKDTVAEVAKYMTQRRAGRVLVADVADHPQGVVTRHIIARAYPPDVDPFAIGEQGNEYGNDRAVSEIMDRGLVTTTWDTPLEEAAELLYTTRCGFLLVTQNGSLVGILDEADVVLALVKVLASEKASLRITVEIGDPQADLASICFPIAQKYQMKIVSCHVITLVNKRIGLIRASGYAPRGFIDELWKSGLKVVDIRR